MIADILYQIGQQLDTFHSDSVTSTTFRITMDNGVPVYHLTVPQLNGKSAEFRDGASVVAFLANINAGIDPEKSVIAIAELETLKAEQLLRDAKIAALEKEVTELPQTQVLMDAQAAASKIIADANAKLAMVAEQTAALEAEAIAKQAEADAAELLAASAAE